jgi:hypothetical protein
MKGDSRFDSRTAAAFRDDGKFPTDQVKSFAHTNQTESMPSVLDIRNETDSVVRDLEVNFVGTSNNLDVDIFRVTMFGDVVQCFLDDSKRQSATSADRLLRTPEQLHCAGIRYCSPNSRHRPLTATTKPSNSSCDEWSWCDRLPTTRPRSLSLPP